MKKFLKTLHAIAWQIGEFIPRIMRFVTYLLLSEVLVFVFLGDKWCLGYIVFCLFFTSYSLVCDLYYGGKK